MAVSKKNIEELSDLINNHVADLQRIGANWSDDILKELHQAQKEILEFVISSQKKFGAVGVDAATNKKFEIIKKRIEQLLNQAYSQSLEGIQSEAKSLAENDAKWAGSLTKAFSGGAVQQIGKRSVENIAKYGRFNGVTLAEMFNSMAVSDADRIFKTVAGNIKSGSSPQSLQKAVKKTFDVCDYYAKSMGLTCANGIANDAKLEVYSKNSDVVKKILIFNTLDGRTCPTCASFGGKIYDADAKDLPALPLHIRCRCVYLPVTDLTDLSKITRPAANADFMAMAERSYNEKFKGKKKWSDLKEETRIGYYYDEIKKYEAGGKQAFKQLPGSMKFEEYLGKQSAEFQKDWLGTTRYRLYKNGGLSVKEMMDPQTNRFFTIAELKKRDIEAFRKAGIL